MVFAMSGAARADTVIYNFNDGTTDGLVTTSAGTGFSSSVSGGVLNTAKAAGDSSNGGIYNFTAYNISGDFTATVAVDRIDLSNGGSLELDFEGNTADVFFAGGGQIEGKLYSPGYTLNAVNDSSTQATFEIQRVGDTITESYNTGSGFVTLNTGTDASLGVSGNITLAEQRYSGASNANSGYFDNLTITSDSIVAAPLPTSLSAELCLLGLLGMGTLIRRLRTQSI
jgi:hypothetical protein